MGKSLEFLFDLMSPYSYLAATQIPGLAQRTSASVTWVPVYLPGVMRATGNRGPTDVAPKAIYTFKDLNDWARHYGLPQIVLPDEFPFQAAAGDRLVLAAAEAGKGPELALALYRKIWAERQNANDDATLRDAVTEVGLDPAVLMPRAQSDEVRARLKANTERAVERGALGCPTFFVDGDQMFVGNDRLMFVEKALKS
ncbi:MAG: 2-hydroxychromene-2-carboxylate isomerase [Myxococcaceae bacterium]|nr:2-hydroxychromene-2-carboxylate isomerase [Myxococcaceae bacterium]